jgi:hypothetical protein
VTSTRETIPAVWYRYVGPEFGDAGPVDVPWSAEVNASLIKMRVGEPLSDALWDEMRTLVGVRWLRVLYPGTGPVETYRPLGCQDVYAEVDLDGANVVTDLRFHF